MFLGNLSDTSSGALVRLSICPDASNCDVVDTQWIPRQQAFVYTSLDEPNRSKLRLYTMRGSEVVHETIAIETNGTLGRLAVSPDGQRVIVERTSARPTVTELWMHDRRDQTFRQFVAAGKSPAWR